MSETDTPSETEPIKWSSFAVQMAMASVMFPILLFLSAGTVKWGMGWVYVAVAIGVSSISRYWMVRRNPDLRTERATALNREDTKRWDKVIVPILIVVGPLSQLIVAGLDFRFEWSPAFAVWVEFMGLGVMLAGYAFTTWAMMTNAYFSSGVRIQTDRGQVVVSTGPYQIVRHPSYLGALVASIGTSLLLSSLWSLIPAVITGVVMVIRTGLEDATLHHELADYPAYAAKTRYRLIPRVW